MDNKLLKTVLVLGFVLFGFISSTEAIQFNLIQADKSSVSFVFKQMNVPVEGNFKRFKGQLNFDPARATEAKGEIEIEIASIDAGSDEANDTISEKQWFNTKVYPVARFVATSVKPLGNNRFEVTGKMTIKGKSLEAKALGAFHQEGNNGIFDGSFTLNRGDYAIGEGAWADYGTVANEVQIKFKLVASSLVKK